MGSKAKGNADKTDSGYNFIDGIQKIIDANHRVLSYVLYGVGGVGAILIVRNAYLFRTFNHVSQVPERFIKGQVRLLGKVNSVGEDSTLYIQHIPTLAQPKLPFVKPAQCHPLPVSLAFVEASPAGQQWLVENVRDKNVWFHLLHRAEGRVPMLYSRVEVPMTFKNIKVNEELIHKGFCKVTALGGGDKPASVIPSDQRLTQFLDRLIAIETRASSKGVGMWLDEDFEKKKRWRTRGITFVKNVLLSPYNGAAWLYKKIRGQKT